jgi:histidinol phosphatase-like PHP family hydrolase
MRNHTKINLHNHTTFSDGRFTPKEIIEEAIAHGLSHIGISDHFRTDKLAATAQYVIPDFWSDYVGSLRQLATQYAEHIQVLVGLEVDFSSRTPLNQLWAGGFSHTILNDLDYVLFEYVSDETQEGLPLNALLVYRRRIAPPVGLAHSLIAQNFGGQQKAQALVETLEAHDLFVELCPSPRNSWVDEAGNRIPYYRHPDPYNVAFWRALRDSEVLLSIGTDTHDRLSEVHAIEDAQQFLRENQLQDHLLTTKHWAAD